MFKRVCGIVLCVFMLGLTACGGGGQSQTTAAPAAAETTAAPATTTAAAAEPATTAAEKAVEFDMLKEPWDTAYPETIKITMVNREQSTLIFPDGGTQEDNLWFQCMKNRLNIQLVNDWISAEYDTSLNLAIASQNLPDIYFVKNPQFKQVVDAGLAYDITDVYNALASETLRKFNDTDKTVLEAAMRNGRIMGQPRIGWGNNVDRPCFIWLRQDWMKELVGSNDPPGSIDAFVDIVRQMNETYGTKGMALEKTIDWILQIAPSWRAYPLIWVDVNGSIEYGGIQPEMKSALETWAKWYAEGLIAPEFAAKDFDAMSQDIINGVHGAFPMWQWAGWSFGADSVRNNGQEAWFRPYLVPTVDGSQQMVPIKFDNGDEVIIVNKDCKYPEAAIKLIDMYVYIENDSYPHDVKTVEEYSKYNDNDMQHYLPFRVNNPLGEYTQYLETQYALAHDRDTTHFTNTMGLNKYNNTILWLDDHDPDGLGCAMQVGATDICAYALAEPYFLNNWFLKSKMWGPSPDALLRYGSTLQDQLIEGYTKIIMGVEPIEYFDKLVDEWKTAGGAEVTDAVNAEYK